MLLLGLVHGIQERGRRWGLVVAEWRGLGRLLLLLLLLLHEMLSSGRLLPRGLLVLVLLHWLP